MKRLALALLVGVAALPCTAQAKTHAPKLDADTINNAPMPREAQPARGKHAKAPAKVDPGYLKAQVLLDRQRFSPGAIDGKDGDNFHKALAAFQEARGLPVSGKLDQATWDALNQDKKTVMTEYEIKKADLKGPFIKKIPSKLEEQAKLKKLAYRTPREMFAERFHVDEPLLSQLNPRESFKKDGDTLLVPDVTREGNAAKVTRVEIDKDQRVLRAFSDDGRLVASYPATIGSDDKPAPTGDFKITGIAKDPIYHYDPKYAFKGVKATEPFTVAAGPNSPVGAVWIDLSIPSYGIHGTAEPSRIGKTFSHGCVRLTNWDVKDLAGMVKKGTQAVFNDVSPTIETGSIKKPTQGQDEAPAAGQQHSTATNAGASPRGIPSFFLAPPLSATAAGRM